MKRLPAFMIFFLAFSLLPPACRSQAWSGILDPSRAANWSGAGVQGGIPAYNNICQTISPSGDSSGGTDSSHINSALAACAKSASASSPQVVLLQPGTYYMAAGINFDAISFVVLRGAGPDETVLKWVSNPGSAGLCGHATGVDICLAGNQYGPGGYFWRGGSSAWTGTNGSIGTYTQGAAVIDVTSTAGLSAGQPINLDQRNDAVGICPQTGGRGNCQGVTGLTNSGGMVTVVTSVPHGFRAGEQVMIGSNEGNSLSRGGGYSGIFTISSVPSAPTCSDALGNSGPCSFTYADSNSLSSPATTMFAAVDTGGAFTCGIDAACVLGNANYIGRSCQGGNAGNQCANGEISERSENEVHLIAAVCTGSGAGSGAASAVAQCRSANELVLAEGVMSSNFRTSQDPGVWWTGSFPSQYDQYDGVEGITFDTAEDHNAYASVELVNTANCWLKNVRGLNASQEHVDVDASSVHDSIVDSYFWGTASRGSGSYGILLGATSYTLLQNNIFAHVVAGIINDQAWGDVAAYNYAVDSGYNNPAWLMTQTSTNHAFAGYNLWEGNDTEFMVPDDIHGTSYALTFFRNRLRAQDTPARLNSLQAGGAAAFERAVNFIGNVMGTSGSTTQYQTSAQIPPEPSGYIYVWQSSAGYVEDAASSTPLALDPLSLSTSLRWGNYDTASGSVQWNGSEIPTSGFAYLNANPIPSSDSLPASLYLFSQPSFWSTPWGTPSWPAIGPDVTGGNAPDGAGGHSYAIPAQLCAMNTPVDPAYQQSFPVSGATWSTSTNPPTATLTIGSNTLAAADTVTISGVNPPGYNGTYSVTSATSNSVSYMLPSNPGPYISGGTVNYPNILLFNAAKCYPGAYTGGPAPPSNVSAVVH